MRLLNLLQREPAAMGTLLTSILPCLVLLGLLHFDEKQIAALVVAVNALVAFCVRLRVTPRDLGSPPAPMPAPQQAG